MVDVGAHVGVFSLWAARRYPDARVYAIEPASESFDCLRVNLRQGRMANVEALQAAAGGLARRAILYRRGFAAANTLAESDNYGSRFEPLETVEVLPLEEIFSRFGIDSCDLLKVDCEGAEYELLLEAASDTLRRVGAIAAEVHVGLVDHSSAELERRLAREGFTVSTTPLQDIEAGGYLYAVR